MIALGQLRIEPYFIIQCSPIIAKISITVFLALDDINRFRNESSLFFRYCYNETIIIPNLYCVIRLMIHFWASHVVATQHYAVCFTLVFELFHKKLNFFDLYNCNLFTFIVVSDRCWCNKCILYTTLLVRDCDFDTAFCCRYM